MNYKSLDPYVQNSSHNLVKLQILFSFVIIVGKELKRLIAYMKKLLSLK
jgi:hypothetical protein